MSRLLDPAHCARENGPGGTRSARSATWCPAAPRAGEVRQGWITVCNHAFRVIGAHPAASNSWRAGDDRGGAGRLMTGRTEGRAR